VQIAVFSPNTYALRRRKLSGVSSVRYTLSCCCISCPGDFACRANWQSGLP